MSTKVNINEFVERSTKVNINEFVERHGEETVADMEEHILMLVEDAVIAERSRCFRVCTNHLSDGFIYTEVVQDILEDD